MFYSVNLEFIHSHEGIVQKQIYITKQTQNIKYQLKFYKKYGYMLKHQSNLPKIIQIVKQQAEQNSDLRKPYLDLQLEDKDKQFKAYNQFAEKFRQRDYKEAFLILLECYNNETQNEQFINLMMMRIYMEQGLADVFNVQTDFYKAIHIFVDDYMKNGLIQNKILNEFQIWGVQLLYIYLDCFNELHNVIQDIIQQKVEQEQSLNEREKKKSDLAIYRILLILLRENDKKMIHLVRDIEEKLKNVILIGSVEEKTRNVGGLNILLGDLHTELFRGYLLENEYDQIYEYYKQATRNNMPIGQIRIVALNQQVLRSELPNLKRQKIIKNNQLCIQKNIYPNNQYIIDYNINHIKEVLLIYDYLVEFFNQKQYCYLQELIEILIIKIKSITSMLVNKKNKRSKQLLQSDTKNLQSLNNQNLEDIIKIKNKYEKQSSNVQSNQQKDSQEDISNQQEIEQEQENENEEYNDLVDNSNSKQLIKQQTEYVVHNKHSSYEDTSQSLINNLKNEDSMLSQYFGKLQEISKTSKEYFFYQAYMEELKSEDYYKTIKMYKYILKEGSFYKKYMTVNRISKLYHRIVNCHDLQVIETLSQLKYFFLMKEIEERLYKQKQQDTICYLVYQLIYKFFYKGVLIGDNFLIQGRFQQYLKQNEQDLSHRILLHKIKNKKRLITEKKREIKKDEYDKMVIHELYRFQQNQVTFSFYENLVQQKMNEFLENFVDKIFESHIRHCLMKNEQYVNQNMNTAQDLFEYDNGSTQIRNILIDEQTINQYKENSLNQILNYVNDQLREVTLIFQQDVVELFSENEGMFRNNKQLFDYRIVQINNSYNGMLDQINRLKIVLGYQSCYLQRAYGVVIEMKEEQVWVYVLQEKGNRSLKSFIQERDQLNQPNNNQFIYNLFEAISCLINCQVGIQSINPKNVILQTESNQILKINLVNNFNIKLNKNELMKQLGLFIYNIIMIDQQLESYDVLTMELIFRYITENFYNDMLQKMLFDKKSNLHEIIQSFKEMYYLKHKKQNLINHDLIQIDIYLGNQFQEIDLEKENQLIYLVNGIIYDGNVIVVAKENQYLIPEGFGRLQYLEQISYKGNFMQGMYEGTGVLINRKQKLVFEGQFSGNSPQKGVLHQYIQSENSYQEFKTNSSQHNYIEFHSQYCMLQQMYLDKIVKEYNVKTISIDTTAYMEQIVGKQSNTSIDINNNVISYDQNYGVITIFKNSLIDWKTLIYNKFVTPRQIIYSSIFEYGQFEYIQIVQNMIQENRHTNIYNVIQNIENQGIIYHNFGRKVEGRFKGHQMLRGIKFKKYSQFKHFDNQSPLFKGKIKDNDQRIYEGQIYQEDYKQFKQNYGQETINGIFIYKGQYKNNLPNGKGFLLDIKNQRIYLKGVFKKGVIRRGKYYKEKDKIFEGIFDFYQGVLLSIYELKSIQQLTDKVQMYGWANLKNGVNIFGMFDQFKDENINGQYKVIYQNGSIIYNGNMTNGAKKGQGQYIIIKDIEDSITINGDWQNNSVKGVVIWDKRNQVDRSHGRFKFKEQDIIMEGFGIMKYKNQSIHRGYYQDNHLKKIGQYIQYVKKQDRLMKISYIGNFEQGLQSGFGIEQKDDMKGFEFKGEFVGNQKNGYGYYYRKGKLYLEGYFVKDEIQAGWLYLDQSEQVEKIEAYKFEFNQQKNTFEPIGNGRIYMRNSVVIECQLNKVVQQILKGRFCREGIIIYPEGRVYEGEIYNYKMDGWGRLRIKGGRILYEGQFKNNNIYGFGRYYDKNGEIHIGNFVKGFKQGFGICYSNPNHNENIVLVGFWNYGLKQKIFKQLTEGNQSKQQIYIEYKNNHVKKVLLDL